MDVIKTENDFKIVVSEIITKLDLNADLFLKFCEEYKDSETTLETNLRFGFIKHHYGTLKDVFKLSDSIDDIRNKLNIVGIKSNPNESILKPIQLTLKSKKDKYNEFDSDDDDYYDYKSNYYGLTSGHQKALQKNAELVNDLSNLRKNALNIGTNKLKRRLNKLAETDINAKIVRLMFEIEDTSVQAKATYGKYRQKKYDIKSKLILDLIDLYKENNYIYGKASSNVSDTNLIIFFELSNNVQISWHSNIYNSGNIPNYPKEWDGLVNSTFGKLLDYVKDNYSEILNK